MKSIKVAVLSMVLLALVTGCNRNETVNNGVASTEPTDTVVAHEASLESITITGIVQQLQRGKDGYTAELRDANDSLFFATVSHSNLTDAAQYKDAKAGDTLNVTGQSFFMEGHTHITVRELK